jgi:nucleoside-diphosphate-sugar epimerase
MIKEFIFMKNKGRVITKVGITGAGGQIGRVLTEGLADKYKLTLFVRNSQPENPRGFRLIKADLSKKEEVKGIFEGLDAVIHLGANPSDRARWESVLQNNIIATYNVFEEARRAGVRRVIFASSNHIQAGYAMGEKTSSLDPDFYNSGKLIRLSDPPSPDSYYGVSKLFGEDLGRYYSRLHGIEFISVRIGWAAPQKAPQKFEEKSIEMYLRAIFFSQRDCVDLFIRTLEVEADFLVVYGVSNTNHPIFDLTETKQILGYDPQDSEGEYFKGISLDISS